MLIGVFLYFQSFFGRTYNNIGSISECKNNGECVINKKNRTACKACRLRKCLLVGMSKSGSRYGRRSNWFKIHCLIQEQQQQAGAGLAVAAASNLLRPHPYLPLFRNLPVTRDARSSESDSGASSADPEDEMRSSSSLSYLKVSASPSSERDYFSGSSKKLPSPASDNECLSRREIAAAASHAIPRSPASLPAISPGGMVPRWLPPLQGVADPAMWRDLWLRGPFTVAAPAPDQEEPIDLSVRSSSPQVNREVQLDNEIRVDVDVNDEPVKSVPLDLTLDRQTDVVTN